LKDRYWIFWSISGLVNKLNALIPCSIDRVVRCWHFIERFSENAVREWLGSRTFGGLDVGV